MEQTTANLLAGFLGGILKYLRRFLSDPRNRWAAMLTGAITGACSAVYLTPLIVPASFGSEKATGFAFLLGVLGMEGVEMIINKFRDRNATGDDK